MELSAMQLSSGSSLKQQRQTTLTKKKKNLQRTVRNLCFGFHKIATNVAVHLKP